MYCAGPFVTAMAGLMANGSHALPPPPARVMDTDKVLTMSDLLQGAAGATEALLL